MKKFENQVRLAVKQIVFSTTYIPGVIEKLDMYKAEFEPLGVSSYGSTLAEAIVNAKIQAEAELMVNSSLVEKLLK